MKKPGLRSLRSIRPRHVGVQFFGELAVAWKIAVTFDCA
jgi:hypothetical protein